MSEGTDTSTATKNDSPASSIVDTIFDIGTGWAAHGLTIGKLALQQSAKTLEATAKALEKLATELDSKEKTDKAAPKA
jgi:hypothetical protein